MIISRASFTVVAVVIRPVFIFFLSHLRILVDFQVASFRLRFEVIATLSSLKNCFVVFIESIVESGRVVNSFIATMAIVTMMAIIICRDYNCNS